MLISFTVTAKLISTFVFVKWIVQSIDNINPKLQVTSHLLWLYSLVCVGPGQKPQRPVFSQRGSFDDSSGIMFAYFSMNTHVIDIHYTHLTVQILISTQFICLKGKLTRIILQLSSNNHTICSIGTISEIVSGTAETRNCY